MGYYHVLNRRGLTLESKALFLVNCSINNRNAIAMTHERLLFFENYVILRQTKTVTCLTIGLVYGNCRKNVIHEKKQPEDRLY